MIKFFLTLLAGGIATSFAEEKFQYSLWRDISLGYQYLKGLFKRGE